MQLLFISSIMIVLMFGHNKIVGMVILFSPLHKRDLVVIASIWASIIFPLPSHNFGNEACYLIGLCFFIVMVDPFKSNSTDLSGIPC